MRILSLFPRIRHIRKAILWFAICLACVLFQTDVENIGTILSLVILTMFYLYFFSQCKLKTNRTAGYLLIFISVIVFASLLYNHDQKETFKFAIQAFMCVCCCSLTMTHEEYFFTKGLFVLFMCINCGVCTYSIFNNPNGLLIHDSINMYGTYFDPNFVCLPFVAASVISLNEAIVNKRWLYFIPFVIMFFTILITASRGAILAFVLSNSLLLFGTILKRGRRSSLLFAIIGIVALVYVYNYIDSEIFSTSDNSARIEQRKELENMDSGRFDYWKMGLNLFEEHPVLGMGIIGFYEEIGHANHNTYMQVLTGSGLIGSLFFAIFIVSVLKRARRMDYGIFCMLAGLLIQITFLDTLNSRYLWPLLSLAIMAPKQVLQVEK